MNFFRHFANRIRKNQRVYVFVICFLIAALFWFLLVLTKEYPSSLNVNVAYHDFPAGLVQVSRLPEKFVLNIKANGYSLMSLDEYDESNKLNINVKTLIGTEPGVKKISSHALIDNIVQQLGPDISITSIQPDTLVFELSYSTTVKLPVRAVLDITFDKQFDSVSSELNPDSVTVTMPVSYLGTITRIETETIKDTLLRESLKRNVKLISPEGVSVDPPETEFTLQVEKFTEGKVQVPVNLIKVPAGITIKIYPDVVTVKYLVSLSDYARIKPEMFTVTADASLVSSDNNDELRVEIVKTPPGVRSVSCLPQQVEFILKK